jgi:hypothetical protein
MTIQFKPIATAQVGDAVILDCPRRGIRSAEVARTRVCDGFEQVKIDIHWLRRDTGRPNSSPSASSLLPPTVIDNPTDQQRACAEDHRRKVLERRHRGELARLERERRAMEFDTTAVKLIRDDRATPQTFASLAVEREIMFAMDFYVHDSKRSWADTLDKITEGAIQA